MQPGIQKCLAGNENIHADCHKSVQFKLFSMGNNLGGEVQNTHMTLVTQKTEAVKLFHLNQD